MIYWALGREDEGMRHGLFGGLCAAVGVALAVLAAPMSAAGQQMQGMQVTSANFGDGG
jgi:hypothetical protein